MLLGAFTAALTKPLFLTLRAFRLSPTHKPSYSTLVVTEPTRTAFLYFSESVIGSAARPGKQHSDSQRGMVLQAYSAWCSSSLSVPG